MKVTENISLRALNSFGVEARAARLVEWGTAPELAEVDFSGRWMALGGGNNVLFAGDYNGTLVRSAARAIEVSDETADTLSVRAEAGVDWDDFVAWSVSRGVWGVENLSAIPGTVGAAPIQNIGAYGAEAADTIVSVECFAVDSRSTLTLARDHCEFGYRSSVFKGALRGKVVVTAVDFALSKEPKPNLQYAALADRVAAPTLAAIRAAVIEIRKGKLPDPRTTGNAGSFFKNPVVDAAAAEKLAREYPQMPLWPVSDGGNKPGGGESKLSAGWLIEAAGWRGRSLGNVGIHRDQALVVVNLGGATGREIVDFAARVQADVHKKFGVTLETEVNVVS